MATSEKILNEQLREKFVKLVTDYFVGLDEDVLRIKSNEIAIPTLDSAGEDKWIQIVIKVPTGSRDGDAFDGYSLKEEYELKLKSKAEKEKENAEKKAQKIERDKAMRAQKEKMKEKREMK